MPEADRIFFVLNPESPDWARLHSEGFRLVAFGSPEHVSAVCQADIIASSQASLPVLWPLPKRFLHDLTHYRFVFLQHGVIMNDLSDWLNQLPIDLFITTTPDEFSAVTVPDSPYRYSRRDTVLTGLSRHDALLARPRQRRWLTVAPTWRRWLVGQVDSQTMRRSRKRGFSRSKFARAWTALICDDRFTELASAGGLEILFLPHPNLRPLLGDLALPDHIQIYDPIRHGSYQDVMAATALCVTDYSSLTADMAVLDIPIVYYQFDAAEVFGGRHSVAAGYFDYVRDGFGPVAESVEEALSGISKLLAGHEDPDFAVRRNCTLVCRDGNNSARIRSAILERLMPAPE